jgi:outer membrane protein assembly factor BamB
VNHTGSGKEDAMKEQVARNSRVRPSLVLPFVATAVAAMGCGPDERAGALASLQLEESDAPKQDSLQSVEQHPLDPAKFKVLQGSCSTVWTQKAEVPEVSGSLLAVGDLDGDRVSDLVSSHDVLQADGSATSILDVRSGATGALLWSASFDRLIVAKALAGGLGHEHGRTLVLTTTRFTPTCTPDSCTSPHPEPYHLEAFSLRAQEVVWTSEGPAGDPQFGAIVREVEDETGDGAPDLLVASPSPLPNGSPGRLYLVSGASGEIVAGLPTPADASVDFGLGLAALPRHPFSHRARATFVVGDPLGPIQLFGAGRVTALALATGELLWTWTGSVPEDGGWLSSPDLAGAPIVAAALSRRGTFDVVVGAHGHSESAEGNEGEVVALDGETGGVLWTVLGRRSLEQLGITIEKVGDLDGDGVVDLLVGAPTPSAPLIILGQGGRIAILSGRTGEVLVDVESIIGSSEPSDFLGEVAASLSQSFARRAFIALKIGDELQLWRCRQ